MFSAAGLSGRAANWTVNFTGISVQHWTLILFFLLLFFMDDEEVTAAFQLMVLLHWVFFRVFFKCSSIAFYLSLSGNRCNQAAVDK